MGQLILPNSGFVYIDTNAIIYSVEKIDPYRLILQPMWLAAQAGHFTVVSSELTLLESLIKPLQNADTILEASFRALLLGSQEIRLIPISRSVLETAAHLRATTGIKTPDAIHAATAMVAGCAVFITNDKDYHRIPGLPVEVLSEVTSSGR